VTTTTGQRRDKGHSRRLQPHPAGPHQEWRQCQLESADPATLIGRTFPETITPYSTLYKTVSRSVVTTTRKYGALKSASRRQTLVVRAGAKPAPRPAPVAPAPVVRGGGATTLCNDGTLSFAAHHQGACSWHGGVAFFYW
jgi:Protein of unknown function (DUF3761)